ncbi:(2Fe-2S)-binding domain protein [Sulfobacillus acidophilus TPY]|uniref:(2Fe-2S)-binding domain-containing protein n=1 Tax=Sulfobacillus acidophilus (strain ATCC 700253 / DSM 10332 / NAL) TaxID=679936 RepID=G8TU98_SULAD|nr:(2Fe-2S)-binding domain protein [Sulfobacillus acidophilus TPY]AEW05770.1 (2Fe-2S)-binding domain-containing protein [Sulfobacillus acidophilus DSM 10332]
MTTELPLDTRKVRLTVNDIPYDLLVPNDERLLETLRERLHLFSARYGCGSGHCGSCVVWVDHKPVPSCLVLTGRVKGKVTTLEGLAQDPAMQRLLDAFSEEHAAQCGYCTPGMLMSARHRLEQSNGELDEEAWKDVLEGHVCRCTGYYAPLRALKRVTPHAVD